MNEAHDHLATDFLGVYQLLWLLRGSDFELGDHEAITLARQTAVELISSGQAHLVLLRWPTDEVLSEHCDERQLDNDSVFDIENNNDDSYLALSPTTPWT
ncbi:hypothetical protein NBRGN_110_01840 [Nocardia brasiliensis NBRC 14402]|uniref:hypothetical protein n=1 Tax=Nocardia brasiliensis TaxID=37326 RepID=UPI0002F401D2|nr:hypothetical protein [Nocardia brasiliensis]ASF09525.1 hypothetical protein CEQ30_21605 [Nocardia brasiliensis]GAJ86519.1 hypothetical protein NBRGN_110_01840 [Nocardia brasiliensis NBRC 14402]SUB55473.1 Uncharacterised protein [Nocardia brasiliensis]